MLQIQTFTLGPLATNAYLLTPPHSNKGILIDPGKPDPMLLESIRDIELEAILLTHAHFDHIGGVEAVRELKRCPVYIHSAEADWLNDAEKNGSTLWPEVSEPITAGDAEVVIEKEAPITFIGETFQVFHVPGHSPGSVAFFHESQKQIFSGDVLFRLGVGRTDLPGGSTNELYHSLHAKLFTLDPSVIVYPGHGEPTEIGYEQQNNPYA